MDFLGPLATLLLCSLSSLRLPSCSPRTSGGSQLCLHFELLNSTACLLKNPTQACSPFIYGMAPLYIHQSTIKRQHQVKHYPQCTPPWKPYYGTIILVMSTIRASSGQKWAEGQLKDPELWVKDRKAEEYLQHEQTPQVQRITLDRYLMWRVIYAEHHFASLESPKD